MLLLCWRTAQQSISPQCLGQDRPSPLALLLQACRFSVTGPTTATCANKVPTNPQLHGLSVEALTIDPKTLHRLAPCRPGAGAGAWRGTRAAPRAPPPGCIPQALMLKRYTGSRLVVQVRARALGAARVQHLPRLRQHALRLGLRHAGGGGRVGHACAFDQAVEAGELAVRVAVPSRLS